MLHRRGVLLGAFADLCVPDVTATTAFYRALLDLETIVDLGWYVELGVGERVLLALVLDGHETIPAEVRGPPGGLLVSFEVDDVPAVAERVAAIGCRVVHGPVDELGQRHVMVADPSGTIVDVIQRIPLTMDDRRRLAGLRHAGRLGRRADR
jgi:catechol 2,3-dioxygenase-like lactoylglutathione lyase family enzyme